MNIEPIEGACAWPGREIENAPGWRRELDPRHVAEIDSALAHLRSQGLDWRSVGREHFPLPTLGRLLARIGGDLEEGLGLAQSAPR